MFWISTSIDDEDIFTSAGVDPEGPPPIPAQDAIMAVAQQVHQSSDYGSGTLYIHEDIVISGSGLRLEHGNATGVTLDFLGNQIVSRGLKNNVATIKITNANRFTLRNCRISISSRQQTPVIRIITTNGDELEHLRIEDIEIQTEPLETGSTGGGGVIRPASSPCDGIFIGVNGGTMIYARLSRIFMRGVGTPLRISSLGSEGSSSPNWMNYSDFTGIYAEDFQHFIAFDNYLVPRNELQNGNLFEHMIGLASARTRSGITNISRAHNFFNHVGVVRLPDQPKEYTGWSVQANVPNYSNPPTYICAMELSCLQTQSTGTYVVAPAPGDLETICSTS